MFTVTSFVYPYNNQSDTAQIALTTSQTKNNWFVDDPVSYPPLANPNLIELSGDPSSTFQIKALDATSNSLYIITDQGASSVALGFANLDGFYIVTGYRIEMAPTFNIEIYG